MVPQVKAQMATAPMLFIPELGMVDSSSNVSNTSLVAVLTEVIDGEEKVREFASGTMTPAERF